MFLRCRIRISALKDILETWEAWYLSIQNYVTFRINLTLPSLRTLYLSPVGYFYECRMRDGALNESIVLVYIILTSFKAVYTFDTNFRKLVCFPYSDVIDLFLSL